MPKLENFLSVLELLDLPSEILLLIFDYLPPRTLFFSVRLVCQRFYQLLMNDLYFKKRFSIRYRSRRDFSLENADSFLKSYVLMEDVSNDIFTWTDLAVCTDVRESWCSREDGFECLSLSEPHTATVDVVKLLAKGQLCVSGGRDKLLCLWDVAGRPVSTVREAHAGWVWDLCPAREDGFFSCGWERTIKEWTVDRGLELVRTYQTEQRAMRLATGPGLLLAGLQTGWVVLFDTRLRESVGSYKAHGGTVTGLALWGQTVLSAGEDRRAAAYDLRTGGKARLAGLEGAACPRSAALHGDLWYLGDRKGRLSVLRADDLARPVFWGWAQSPLNAVRPSVGGVLLGTADGRLAFLSPLLHSPRLLKLVRYSGEVTSIDCRNNIIAIGTSDWKSCIQVLKAKDTDHN